MRAMVLERLGAPLIMRDVPCPEPADREVLIKVSVCGVCRTDVHIVDGELPHPKLPLILGHQIVGSIVKKGKRAEKYRLGERVGVPWLAHCCQHCEYCLSGRENLCDTPTFTGYTCQGGYAEYCTAHEDFILTIPDSYDSPHAAPLLCAGLIGYRAFRLAAPHKTIGFYGFGSSAHLLIQLAAWQGFQVYVFTRPGDVEKQQFARSLGAAWAGDSTSLPPFPLDAAILFAPSGELYPLALKAVKKGGRVVSAGIHMSDIPTFPYRLLWEERTMTSVANLTREDGTRFMDLAGKLTMHVNLTTFPLAEANQAIDAIRKGSIDGSVVLTI